VDLIRPTSSLLPHRSFVATNRAADFLSSFLTAVFVILFTVGCATSVNHTWADEPLTGCNYPSGCTSNDCYWEDVCDDINDCLCLYEFVVGGFLCDCFPSGTT